MSAPCRENRPLLCDDYSDEDFFIRKSSPKFQRLFRYSASSGRARSQAIGAAAIITRWPEHFSSLLTYWWIGLGMIAFMVFVIYNSIVVITMLPPTHTKPMRNHITEYSSEITLNENSKTNIYMHIFVTNYEELDIYNNYFPYIAAFSKNYTNLKHNLIVVLKDVSHDNLNNLNDELNNEIALNSLWTEKKNDNLIKLGGNINIQFISLTKYMDESPLKIYWRRLPQQFFGFLTRCIAIWDKGGVAFDPLILTPNSSNSGYIERLDHILSNLMSLKNAKKSKKEKEIKMPRRKVNNIRDIIDNIENEDKNAMQESLLEAENKMSIFKIHNLNVNRIKRNVTGISLENYKNSYINNIHGNKTRDSEEILHKNKIEENSAVLIEENRFNHISTTYGLKNKNKLDDEITTTKNNLLPIFLEYLFQKPQNVTKYAKEQSNGIVNVNKNINSIIKQPNNSIATTMSEKKGLNTLYADRNSSENENNISLSIDLKGSLIATETPCHAFIGTIFSNALHHSDDESITDFIITELSFFCKGVLSSCKGIDVILL